MTTLINTRFSFDPTGQANSNLIVDELQNIASNGSRIVIPREGVFYTKDFTIRPRSGGTALRLNEDYHFTILDIEITAQTGLEAACAIEIDNVHIFGEYLITYHCAGGVEGKSNALVQSLLEGIQKAEQSTVDWNKIINLPAQYPPEQHTHQVIDLTGLEMVSQAINGLERAILDSRPMQLSGLNLHWQDERILHLLAAINNRINNLFFYLTSFNFDNKFAEMEARLKAYIDSNAGPGVEEVELLNAIAHYTYETINGLVVADESGTYPATIVGNKTLVTGPRVKALQGDFNNYKTIPNLGTWFSYRKKFSFCGFFKPSTNTIGVGPILCASTPGNAAPNYSLLLRFTPTKVEVFVGNYPTAVAVDGTYDPDRYYHIAATYINSQYKVYIDAVLVKTITTNATTGPTAGPMMLGRIPEANSSSNASNWCVDDLRFYNRVLTLAEIIQLARQDLVDGEMYPGLNVYDCGSISGPSPLVEGSTYEADIVDLNAQSGGGGGGEPYVGFNVYDANGISSQSPVTEGATIESDRIDLNPQGGVEEPDPETLVVATPSVTLIQTETDFGTEFSFQGSTIVGGNGHALSYWEVSTNAGFTNVIFSISGVDYLNELDLADTDISLVTNTTYYARVKYEAANGVQSDWSAPVTFKTDPVIGGVSITSPAYGSDVTSDTVFTSSAFVGDGTHVATYWEIIGLYTSGRKTIMLTSFTPSSVGVTLIEGQTYYIRVRYESSTGLFTEWSASANYNVAVIDIPSVTTLKAKLVASDGAPSDSFGKAVAMSGDKLTAVVTSIGDSEMGLNSGSAYVYTSVGGVWTQQAKLLDSTGVAGDKFGSSVSISYNGNTIIIGASEDSDEASKAGAAIVLTRSGTTWTQQKILTVADSGIDTYFGLSVSISDNGETIVVGAKNDDSKGIDAGAMYVYDLTAYGWTLTSSLLASDGAAADLFGKEVCISGDGKTIIVGSVGQDDLISNSGGAYIFEFIDGYWTQTAKLMPSIVNMHSNMLFGDKVCLSRDGKTAVVTAPGSAVDAETTAGAMYVFNNVNGTWTQTARLTSADVKTGDQFGCSVAISANGDIIVVGAFGDDKDYLSTGAAYVFTLVNGTWVQHAEIAADDRYGSDYFGYAVDLSGDGSTAIIGSYGDDDKGNNSGSAYIYDTGLLSAVTILTVNKPTIVEPIVDSSIGVYTNIVGSAFVGDGEHEATFWLIARDPLFTDILLEGRNEDTLNDLSLESQGISYDGDGEDIYIKIRYESSLGAVSEWSEVTKCRLTVANPFVNEMSLRHPVLDGLVYAGMVDWPEEV